MKIFLTALIALIPLILIFFNKICKIISIIMAALCTTAIITHGVITKGPNNVFLFKYLMFAAIFLAVYFLICFFACLCCDSELNARIVWPTLLCGIFTISALIFADRFDDIYNSNISRINYIGEEVVSTSELVSLNSNNELSGKIEGNTSGSYYLFFGSISSALNGEITTESVIEYWYKASDGTIKPGKVQKEDISLVFIQENQTPYMEKIAETSQLVITDQNIQMKYTYQKETNGYRYVFYIPKGSIKEEFNIN